MVDLQRRADWAGRLLTYLHKTRQRPYRPGSMDCAMFTAGAIQAMTDHDFARGWRGKYRSLKRGYAVLQEAGFDSPVDLAAAHLPEWDGVLQGRPGDVAAVDIETGLALGIIQGEQVYLRHLDGLVLLPLTQAIRTFKVGA